MPMKKAKILLVDDDRDFRDSAADYLEGHGYFVLKAASGALALEILEANYVDAIITDIHMPDGNGIELLNAIRLRNPDISTVIVVTGHPDVRDVQALRVAAHSVFQKPLNPQALLSAVEDIIASSARLQLAKESGQ